MIKDNSIKNYYNQYKNNAIFFENIFKRNICKKANELCSQIYYILTGVKLMNEETKNPFLNNEQQQSTNINNNDPFELFGNQDNNNNNQNNDLLNNTNEKNINSATINDNHNIPQKKFSFIKKKEQLSPNPAENNNNIIKMNNNMENNNIFDLLGNTNQQAQNNNNENNNSIQKKKSFDFIKKHKLEKSPNNDNLPLESINFNQKEPKKNELDMNILNQVYQEHNNEMIKMHQQQMDMPITNNNNQMLNMNNNLNINDMNNNISINNNNNMFNMNTGFSQMNNINSQPNVYDSLFDPNLLNQQQSQIVNNENNMINNDNEKNAKVDPFNNLLELMK